MSSELFRTFLDRGVNRSLYKDGLASSSDPTFVRFELKNETRTGKIICFASRFSSVSMILWVLGVEGKAV